MTLDFDEILSDRLWVGGRVCEEDVAQLKRMGITAVISLQTDEDLQSCGIASHLLTIVYQEAGIELHRVPTPDLDREALQRNLPDAVAEVERALAEPHAKLYLHCTFGYNRSPTTAAGFLIKAQGISAAEACKYLCLRRDCTPTVDILEEYEAVQKTKT